jgi:putative endonuclease
MARAFLHCRGLDILETNWRSRSGELDIICRDGQTLVFVEVKTRSENDRGLPGEALTGAKRKRLIKAASRYLTVEDCWDKPCRFDLVAVQLQKDSCVIEHQINVIEISDALGCGHTHWQPW